MKKKEEKKEKKIATAKLRRLNISPRKVRRIADTIRGLSVLEAESELLYRPQRAAQPILKLLRSAFSNVLDKNVKKEKLFVDEIRVDKGPVIGRSVLSKSRGRADVIKKISSHIFLSLNDLKKKAKRKYKVPGVKMIKSEKFVGRYKGREEEKMIKEKEIKNK